MMVVVAPATRSFGMIVPLISGRTGSSHLAVKRARAGVEDPLCPGPHWPSGKQVSRGTKPPRPQPPRRLSPCSAVSEMLPMGPAETEGRLEQPRSRRALERPLLAVIAVGVTICALALVVTAWASVRA